MFLVVLQGDLGDDLGIISRGVFLLYVQFLFCVGWFCSLCTGWTLVHVLLSVVGMSNMVHALVLSSAGIAVRVALAKFHSFGEADAGLHFLPTALMV